MKGINKCTLKRKEGKLRQRCGSESIRNRHTGNITAR
jgi:hypothetical protein